MSRSFCIKAHVRLNCSIYTYTIHNHIRIHYTINLGGGGTCTFAHSSNVAQNLKNVPEESLCHVYEKSGMAVTSFHSTLGKAKRLPFQRRKSFFRNFEFILCIPSVTPFWQWSCHRIILKFPGVITIDRRDVHWIHSCLRNNAHILKWHRRVTLLFFTIICKISRSQGTKKSPILTQIARFRTVTPVCIHKWLRNDVQSLK